MISGFFLWLFVTRVWLSVTLCDSIPVWLSRDFVWLKFQFNRRLTWRMKFATRLTFLINSCNFSSRLFRAPFLSRLIFNPHCLHSYVFFSFKPGCQNPQRVHVFDVPFSPHPQTIFLPSTFRQCHSSLSANIAGATVCMFFRAFVSKPSCDSLDSCKISFESSRYFTLQTLCSSGSHTIML